MVPKITPVDATNINPVLMVRRYSSLSHFLLQLMLQIFHVAFGSEVGFDDPLKDPNLCLSLVLRNSSFLQFLNGFQGIKDHDAVNLTMGQHVLQEKPP